MAAAAAGKILVAGGQQAATTVRNVTGGKGGTALAIFGVLMIGWLFVSGRLAAVGRVISQGRADLDQPRGRAAGRAQEGGVRTLDPPLPQAPIGGLFPGGSLPGTPPIAPPQGTARVTLPDRQNPQNPPVEWEILKGPTCPAAVRTAAKALGYTDAEIAGIIKGTCGVAPVPVGGR